MQVAGDYRIVPIIRTQLTQNIGNFFNEYFEEITNGCDEFIGNKYGGRYPFFSTSFCIIIRIFCDLWDSRLLARMTIIEWVSVNGMNMVARVVFRAINRIFVGLPFCEYTLFFCPSRVLYPIIYLLMSTPNQAVMTISCKSILNMRLNWSRLVIPLNVSLYS